MHVEMFEKVLIAIEVHFYKFLFFVTFCIATSKVS